MRRRCSFAGLCNWWLGSVALRGGDGDRRMDGGRSGFFSRYNYYNVMWHQPTTTTASAAIILLLLPLSCR